MTALKKFKAADQKVTDLESAGHVALSGYGGVTHSEEYKAALAEARRLHDLLVRNGINPFK